MKKNYKPILFFLLLFNLILNETALLAQVTFQRTFQAAGMNGGLSLTLTTDGGYVVTGQHSSSGAGLCDVYVYKRDACGNTDFFNTFGDTASQGGLSIKQTADGGYIVTGITQPKSVSNLILMKLDVGGNLQWVKSFGNSVSSIGMDVQQTSDGGYILTGAIVSPTPYSWDVFLLKTDPAGTYQWSKIFTAAGEEFANYVEQTKDGGFFLSGYSQWSVHSDADVLAIKTDAAGNVQWSNVYGGSKNDGNARADGLSIYAGSAHQTPDGGYAIASETRSFGVNDSVDIWLLKLNSGGSVQWNKTYGGTNNEEPRGMDVTQDGGFAIAGWTMSFGFGEQDVYLLKTDSLGNLNWSKTYGGTNREKGEAVRQSPIDHGYYIDGNSASFNNNFNVDLFDAYAIKTDSLGITGCNETSPVTIVGSGTPVVTPFTYTITAYPLLPDPVFTQNSYTPGEYSLCQTIKPDVAQFSATTVCPWDSTVFTDASTAGYGVVTKWKWNFGDGSQVSSQQNPVHTYSASGTYSVTLVIHTTYSCIPDSITKLVIIKDRPVPLFTSNNVCLNNTTIFADQSTTASGTITNWNWNFGDSNSSSLQNPLHTYTSAGTYTVTQIVTNSLGCKDTIKHKTVVNPLPAASFSTTTICNGNPTCFTDLSTIISGNITGWSWNFSDPGSGSNNTSNIKNPCHTFTSSGNYNVTLVVTSDSSCQTTTVLSVIVLPLPIAAFTAPNKCLKDPIVFTDGSTGATQWNWNFGDGSPIITGVQNPSHTYTASGTYSVTQMVSSSGNCKDTIVNTITVNPLPVPLFTAPVACFNNATIFTDQSATANGILTNWNWNFGDGNISTAPSPSHTYNTSGIFPVTLIVTNSFGCQDSIQKNIVVNPLPAVNFIATTVCVGNATCFTDLSTIASGTITNWSWNFVDPNSGANNISNSQNPCHTFTAAGNYNVILTVTSNNGCQSTINLAVIVKSPPVANFTAPKICLNSSSQFTDGSTGETQWAWNFGDGGISSLQNLVHTYLGYGSYSVTLIVSSGVTCNDTTVDTVTVNPLPIVNFAFDTVCKGKPTTFADLSFIPLGNITAWHWNFGDGDTSMLKNPSHIYSSAGTYTVTLTVTSGKGCSSSAPLTVVVYPLPLANFSFIPGPIVSLTDNIEFKDLSTGGAVHWDWWFGDGDTSAIENPLHLYADTGAYAITLAIISNHGCVDTVKHPIEVKDFTFYIPNSFTPNGDGTNELFFGKGIGITEYEMWIFDRWGNSIFYCKEQGLPQSLPCQWDGTVKGGNNILVQKDVYVWKVHLLNVFGKTYDYIGNVTVMK